MKLQTFKSNLRYLCKLPHTSRCWCITSQHIANTSHLSERNSLFVAFESNPDAYLFHWFLCVPFVSPFLWYWQIAIEKRMKIIKISECKMFNISCIWTSPQLKLKLKREKEKKNTIELSCASDFLAFALYLLFCNVLAFSIIASAVIYGRKDWKTKHPNMHTYRMTSEAFFLSLSRSNCSCGFCGKIELLDDNKRQRPKTEKDLRNGRLFYRETQLSINRYLNPFERFQFHPNDWNNAHF